MVKIDFNRDYYGDLGVSPNATDAEIKKQFRKLALQYHPDRNHGNEEDANEKFQIIGAAHEILSDPTQRAKYNAGRVQYTSGFPRASGVRGNPWANAGSQFQPPPRRGNPRPAGGHAPPPHPTGTGRFSNFASAVPPTAKQTSSSTSTDGLKSAYAAWQNMRNEKNNASPHKKHAGAPPPPPRPTPTEPVRRPVPKTPTQKARAESSFGTPRRAGFHPRSEGDEPPVTSSNYSTSNRRTMENMYANVVDDPEDRPQKYPRQQAPNRNSIPREEAFADTTSEESSSGEEPASRPKFPTLRKKATTTTKTQNQASTEVPQKASYGSASDSNASPTSCNTPDGTTTPIFNFGDIASQLPTDSATGTFNRRSTENIETQFSPQATHGFTFSAGGTFSTETGDADFVGVPPSPRSKVSSTYGETGATTPNVFFGRASSHSPAKQTSFDPTTWSTKFGRETFTPRHVSPTRSNTTRSTAKKHVSTKSSGSQRSNSVDSNNLETPMRRTSKIHMGTTDSPNAMEIDSPPSSGGGTSQQAPPLPPKIPQAANARNVPVEPAKKEWRSGDIGGGSNVHQESLRRKPVDPAFKSQGSEDSPEFYDSMNDLRNVEPFISQPGLGSMDDLKMNLPFESKSAPAPLKDPSQDHAKPQSLNFPPIPCAPVLPMASYTGAALGIAELQGYVVKFQQYLRDWEIFNKRIVTHFYNRHSELELVRESLGAADLLGDAKLVEQLEWARQDREVRNRWSMACEEHERQIRQYLVVKGQATA